MTTVVIDATGNIINSVVLTEGAQWATPDGCTIAVGDYAVGGTLIAGVYTPPVPPSSTPIPLVLSAVSPRQARLALLGAGLLTQVENAVTAAGGATQITWEYATVFERTDPLIATLSAALGLTSAQVDALFATAATL